jgi:hypothetical protein
LTRLIRQKEHPKQNWRQNGTTITTINLTLEDVGAQEPLHIPHSTQINTVDTSSMMSDSKSGASHYASVPDHVNLARFVTGERRKPKHRTCYMYKNSALSAALQLVRCCCVNTYKENGQICK